MKKSIVALVVFLAVVGVILVVRTRTGPSVQPRPNVTVNRTLKEGDLITNGASVQRIQGLLLAGTNAPTQQTKTAAQFQFLQGGMTMTIVTNRVGPPPEPPTPKEAYQQLLSIGEFAFDGVGYFGVTSRGEIAYRVVASTTNALQLFSAALTNGNAQAKLYALCAIRQLSPESFDVHARLVVASSPEAETLSGCILRHEWTSNVVARIAGGSYDLYTKSPKDKRPSPY